MSGRGQNERQGTEWYELRLSDVVQLARGCTCISYRWTARGGGANSIETKKKWNMVLLSHVGPQCNTHPPLLTVADLGGGVRTSLEFN